MIGGMGEAAIVLLEKIGYNCFWEVFEVGLGETQIDYDHTLVYYLILLVGIVSTTSTSSIASLQLLYQSCCSALSLALSMLSDPANLPGMACTHGCSINQLNRLGSYTWSLKTLTLHLIDSTLHDR